MMRIRILMGNMLNDTWWRCGYPAMIGQLALPATWMDVWHS